MAYIQHILHYYTLMTKMWLLSSYFIRPIKHEFIVIMMHGFILHKILEFYILYFNNTGVKNNIEDTLFDSLHCKVAPVAVTNHLCNSLFKIFNVLFFSAIFRDTLSKISMFL